MTLIKKTRKNKGCILPADYFEEFDDSNNCANKFIRLLMGPCKGVVFYFGGNVASGIKIRIDSLTGTPTICYDYTIVDFSNHPETINNSVELSRIIAAIAIELGNDTSTGVTT